MVLAEKRPIASDSSEANDPEDARFLPPPPLGIRKPLALVRVEAVRPLHRPGSTRPTVLVELKAERGDLSWEPGDSLAIFPENDPAEVQAALRWFDADAAATTNDNGLRSDGPSERQRLADYFRWQADVRGVDRRLLETLAKRAALPREDTFRSAWVEEPAVRIASGNLSRDAFKSLDVQDFAQARETDGSFVFASGSLAGETATDLFRRQTPRLYTIAGEGRGRTGEPTIELAVARVEWPRGDDSRLGVASSWLADRARPGTRLWAFVQRNARFRFDHAPEVPQIFVGPGTGIAPFRAELQRRSREGVVGPTWLFFGSRNRATDDWFSGQIRSLLAQGTLTRYDAVFSRDGDDRKYVQHAMLERGAELFDWLERGAIVSICGSARMAPEVEATLVEIVAERSARDFDAARTYVLELRTTGRLRADVY
jgi:sulfite reductase (NADPH) flavoprotein alpha-component